MSVLLKKIAAVPFAREAYHGLVKCAVAYGAPCLWRTLTGRRHAIFTFHRVRPANQPANLFDTCPSVGVEVFRRILEHISEQFSVISLQELCNDSIGKAPAAAITFDDGWRDNYELAFPILCEFGIPATIFVTTSKIGSSELFWQQELGHLFCTANIDPNGETARRLRAVLKVRNSQPLTPDLYRNTVLLWKRLRNAECTSRLVSAGWVALAGSDGYRMFLNTGEMCKMADSGIAFGSHTVTHCILPRYSRLEVERELTESKVVLENLLGEKIDMLAYPDGQCTPEVIDCAREAGYRIACTTRSRRFSQKEGLLRVPRFDVS
jgi:peptidoglycan/xylan/chitin deacetylase (PgdA/CDA1 family)